MGGGTSRKIKAYLSHKWVGDEPSPFAQYLLSVTPDDIALLVDHVDGEPSKDIDQFIAELKTSPFVVFLLSDGFFSSPWCVDELFSFWQRYVVGVQGFYIACDGWWESKNNIARHVSARADWIDGWEKRAEKVSDGTKEKDAIDRILAFARSPQFESDLNRLAGLKFEPDADDCSGTESCLTDGAAPAIWKRFRDLKRRRDDDLRAKTEDAFRNDWKAQVSRWLDDDVASLRGNLVRSLKFSSLAYDEDQPVNSLWDLGLSDALTILFRAIENSFESATMDERLKLRQYSIDLLGLLLMRGINQGTFSELFNNGRSLLDETYLHIEEDSGIVAELTISALQPEPRVRLSFVPGGVNPIEVNVSRRFDGDLVDHGHFRANNTEFQAESLIIWNSVFRRRQKGSNDELTNEDWQKLRDQLKDDFKRGHARYYVVPESKQDHPLFEPGTASKLKYNLPYLMIFRTTSGQAPMLMRVDFDQSELERQLDAFAELFDRYE